MSEERYYSIKWDGHTHFIAECDKHDMLICIYRGFHNHKRDTVALYPYKPGRAYGDIKKKTINIRQIMPKEWKYRRLG